MGYLAIILGILLFGILGFILLPVLVNLTKSAIHRCAKCLNEVKTNSYFGLSSMDDNIVSFQMGSAGVILTRRLLLYIALVLTASLGIYTVLKVESTHNHDEGKNLTAVYVCVVPIDYGITWPQYIKDCGIQALQKNSREARVSYNMHYANRGIEWDGYVVRVKIEEDVDPLNTLHHSATILVKMATDDVAG